MSGRESWAAERRGDNLIDEPSKCAEEQAEELEGRETNECRTRVDHRMKRGNDLH